MILDFKDITEEQLVVIKQLKALESKFMKDLLTIRMKSNHCKRWMLEGRTQVQAGMMAICRSFAVPGGD
jgi:hypothetical protein